MGTVNDIPSGNEDRSLADVFGVAESLHANFYHGFMYPERRTSSPRPHPLVRRPNGRIDRVVARVTPPQLAAVA